MKSLIPGFFLKQGAVLGAILFAILAFTVLPFSSCSTAPTNTNMSASTVDTGNTDDEDEPRRRSSGGNDEPEKCDQDEGEPCRDDEYCEGTCERIYTNQTSVRSCKDRGDETVGMLETVHNRLMGKNAGYDGFKDRDQNRVKDDLQEITDDEDDIGHEELECYLQIGSSKYIDKIKDGLTDDDTNEDNAAGRLHETLNWMVTDKETAKVLHELDKGHLILQAMLEKLSDLRTGAGGTRPDYLCLEDSGFGNKNASVDRPTGASGWQLKRKENIYDNRNQGSLDQALWWLNNDYLKIWYYNISGRVGKEGEIKVEDKDLYNALSCFHLINGENNNIFTFSANKENKFIFEIAFDLLNNISCEDLEKEKKPGCTRALMCWSSWQKNCHETNRNHQGGPDCGESNGHTNDRHNTENLWNMLRDNHRSNLENDGPSKYDHCTTRGFSDFFK